MRFENRYVSNSIIAVSFFQIYDFQSDTQVTQSRLAPLAFESALRSVTGNEFPKKRFQILWLEYSISKSGLEKMKKFTSSLLYYQGCVATRSYSSVSWQSVRTHHHYNHLFVPVITPFNSLVLTPACSNSDLIDLMILSESALELDISAWSFQWISRISIIIAIYFKPSSS